MIIGATADNRQGIKSYYPKAESLDINNNCTIATLTEELMACGSIDQIILIAPGNPLDVLDDQLIENQNLGVLYCFRLIKALLALEYGTKELGWTLITTQTQPTHKDDSINPSHGTLHGLIGSMAKEYSKWQTRLVDLESNCKWPLADIFALPTDPLGNAWAFRDRQWYRQHLIPLSHPAIEQTAYRPKGVYVIIGGAGGIGEAWSEYMIRTYQAQIIWLGRRQADAQIDAKIARLARILLPLSRLMKRSKDVLQQLTA